MEGALDIKREFSKLFLAYYSEKKLTKNIVNSINLEESVASIKDSEKTLSLRLSGQLIIGILRIFIKKCIFILSELELFLSKPFDQVQEHALKEQITTTTQYITLSDHKSRMLSIEEDYSLASISRSHRDSIEVGRNLASKDSITLNEINYTPKSLATGSVHELEFGDNLLQDITPARSMHELEPIEVNTPAISFHVSTPGTFMKKIKNTPGKFRSRKDANTVQEIEKNSETLTKSHLMLKKNKIALDAFSLFHKNMFEIPDELKELYNINTNQETRVIIQEAVDDNIYNFQDDQDIQMGDHQIQQEDEPLVYQAIEKNVINYELSWTESSEELLKIIKAKGKKKSIKFTSLITDNKKKSVRIFSDLLLIASKGLAQIIQYNHFGEIFIKSIN